jgi:hypothetical protein
LPIVEEETKNDNTLLSEPSIGRNIDRPVDINTPTENQDTPSPENETMAPQVEGNINNNEERILAEGEEMPNSLLPSEDPQLMEGVEDPGVAERKKIWNQITNIGRYFYNLFRKNQQLEPAYDMELLRQIAQHSQVYNNILREHAYAQAHSDFMKKTMLGKRILRRIDQKMALIMANKHYVNILNLQTHLHNVNDKIVYLLYKIFLKMAVLQDQSHMDLHDIDVILRTYQASPALRNAINIIINDASKYNHSIHKDDKIHTIYNPIYKKQDNYHVYDVLRKELDPNDNGFISFSGLQQHVNRLLADPALANKSIFKSCLDTITPSQLSTSNESIDIYIIRRRRMNRLKYFILDSLRKAITTETGLTVAVQKFWMSLSEDFVHQEGITNVRKRVETLNPTAVSAKFHQKYQLRSMNKVASRMQSMVEDARYLSFQEDLHSLQLLYILNKLEDEREQREVMEVFQEEAEEKLNHKLMGQKFTTIFNSKASILKQEQLLVTCLEAFLEVYLSTVRIYTSSSEQSSMNENKSLFRTNGGKFTSLGEKYVSLHTEDNDAEDNRELHITRILSSVVEIFVRFFDSSCLGVLDQWEVDHLLNCITTTNSNEEDMENLPLSTLIMSQHLAHLHTKHTSNNTPGSTINAAGAMDAAVTYSCIEVTRFLCMKERIAWIFRPSKNSVSDNGNNGDDSEVDFPAINNTHCARTVLVSVQRRRIRKQIEQSLALTSTGRLIFSDPDQHSDLPKINNNKSSDQSLLLRCQLLAMRQVAVFIRDTTLGKLQQQQIIYHEIHPLFIQCMYKSNAEDDYAMRAMRYAYALHSEGSYVLNTELPHIIDYLIRFEGFVKTVKTQEVSKVIFQCSFKKYLRWVTWEEAHKLLESFLVYNYQQYKHLPEDMSELMFVNTHRYEGDSETRMISRARQQAILLAMNMETVSIKETNYRCSVLGLYALASKMNRVQLPEDNVDEDDEAEAEELEEEDNLPADREFHELIGIYLLSRGYLYSDIFQPAEISNEKDISESKSKDDENLDNEYSLEDIYRPREEKADQVESNDNKDPLLINDEEKIWLQREQWLQCKGTFFDMLNEVFCPERESGELLYSEVGMKKVKELSTNAVWKKLNYQQAMHRSMRYLGSTLGYEKERKRLSAAMRFHKDMVERKGAEFLRELLTGISYYSHEV